MSLHTYPDLIQGSEEWLEARRGLLTASVIGQLITASTIKPAKNDRSRDLIVKLVAERVTGFSEPTFATFDMNRGIWDEPLARDLYSEHYAPVVESGFMVRDDWGFGIGYSPDGLVGDDGLIEAKSRKPKHHLATIVANAVPPENMAQLQCGLLVSGREWVDYLSYCGGMPMWVKRVWPDETWQAVLVEAARIFEDTAAHMAAIYTSAVEGLPATERFDYTDIEMS